MFCSNLKVSKVAIILISDNLSFNYIIIKIIGLSFYMYKKAAFFFFYVCLVGD